MQYKFFFDSFLCLTTSKHICINKSVDTGLVTCDVHWKQDSLLQTPEELRDEEQTFQIEPGCEWTLQKKQQITQKKPHWRIAAMQGGIFKRSVDVAFGDRV